MGTTTTSGAGRDLREARERAGLTRVELAALAGCSLAQLASIEQGAVPKRSQVLRAALAALAHNDGRRALEPGAVQDGEAPPRAQR